MGDRDIESYIEAHFKKDTYVVCDCTSSFSKVFADASYGSTKCLDCDAPFAKLQRAFESKVDKLREDRQKLIDDHAANNVSSDESDDDSDEKSKRKNKRSSAKHPISATVARALPMLEKVYEVGAVAWAKQGGYIGNDAEEALAKFYSVYITCRNNNHNKSKLLDCIRGGADERNEDNVLEWPEANADNVISNLVDIMDHGDDINAWLDSW